MRHILIFNSAYSYRHGYTIAAQRAADHNPDALIVMIGGTGPGLMGSAGECQPCEDEGRPERIPDIWIWSRDAKAQQDFWSLRDSWQGLCNTHADQFHGVQRGLHPE